MTRNLHAEQSMTCHACMPRLVAGTLGLSACDVGVSTAGRAQGSAETPAPALRAAGWLCPQGPASAAAPLAAGCARLGSGSASGPGPPAWPTCRPPADAIRVVELAAVTLLSRQQTLGTARTV